MLKIILKKKKILVVTEKLYKIIVNREVTWIVWGVKNVEEKAQSGEVANRNSYSIKWKNYIYMNLSRGFNHENVIIGLSTLKNFLRFPGLIIKQFFFCIFQLSLYVVKI